MNNDLPPTAFARRRVFHLFLIGTYVVMAVLLIGWLTIPAIGNLLSPQPGRPETVWTGIMVMDVFVMGFVAWKCYRPLVQLGTKFSQAGIEQPSLWGWKSIGWQEAQAVTGLAGDEIVLTGPADTIRLDLTYYKHRKALVQAIQARLPTNVAPGKAQLERETLQYRRSRAVSAVLGALILAAVALLVDHWVVRVMGLLLVLAAAWLAWLWFRLGQSVRRADAEPQDSGGRPS